MVAMCSLSNSKIRLFLILKKKVIILFEKVNKLILLTKYFLSCIFYFFSLEQITF